MIEVITYVGLVLGLFFFVFYWNLNPRIRTNRFLAAYVLFLSMALAEPILASWHFLTERGILLSLLGGIYFLVGPLLLFYCRMQGNAVRRISYKLFFHLIPFAIYTILVVIDYAAQLVGESEWVDLLAFELLYVHIFSYLIISYREMSKSIRRIKTRGEDVKLIKLSWARTLVVLSILLFGFSFLVSNFQSLLVYSVWRYYPEVIQVFLLVIIIAIALLNTEVIKLKRFSS